MNSNSAKTRIRHDWLILDFYGFRPFDSTAKSFAAGEIEKMARSRLQPALILWRIVDSLVKEKIEIPGYCPLAELYPRRRQYPGGGANENNHRFNH